MKIVIFGGSGRMGKIFAKIFKEAGQEVIIVDLNEKEGREMEKNLGVKYTKDNFIVSEADFVIISVPIGATASLIEQIGPLIKDGSLVSDLTSIKFEAVKALDKWINKKAEIISIHPMFGPRVLDVSGQVFILCPIRTGISKFNWLNFIENFFLERKVKVVVSSSEEHDRIMAVIQGLTHFLYITAGWTFKKLDFNVKKSRKLSSPIYDLMLDIIGRILGQDPHLYAHIQMDNPLAKEVRERFIECVIKLNEVINAKDEKEFVEIMDSSARHFLEINSAMSRSDKVISVLSAELEFLKKNIGEEIFLKHIYSKEIHFGNLLVLDGENLILEKNGKKEKLKIANVIVLKDQDEILERKKEFFGMVKKDFSLLIDEDLDEKVIVEILNLQKFTKEIEEIKIKEVYFDKKFGSKKSVCYEISFISRNLKEKIKETIKFLERIGKLRK